MAENEKLDLILSKLGQMDERFDRVDERLDRMDSRLDQMDNRLDQMDNRLDQMDERFDKMDERFDKMDERFDKMDERFDKVENDMTGIKLTLENEIRRNIQIVAEGHLDLYRKLDEAQKIENEKEMIAIRVNTLETELRKVKERLDQIA